MISVDEALAIILKSASPLPVHNHSLDNIAGFILAHDLYANITQPPFPASAMDGYAIHFEDAQLHANLTVIGESAAGHPFLGRVGRGQAVRIFTGAVVPDAADHVIIQEEVSREKNTISITAVQNQIAHIRAAGIDFCKDDLLVKAGTLLHELHGSVLAAANIASAHVISRPKVYLFSTGDELQEPGSDLKPGEIINSNHYAVHALIKKWGGDPVYVGCLKDDRDSVCAFFNNLNGADIIVPIGGASVGDYDIIKPAFTDAGGEIVFEKIAVKPGKPTWYGRFGRTHLVGLPGNPASAIVTAALFLQPLVRRLSGQLSGETDEGQAKHFGVLAQDLGANGARESFLRASIGFDKSGRQNMIHVAPNQDSALLSPFLEANILVRRRPHALSAKAGEKVEFVALV